MTDSHDLNINEINYAKTNSGSINYQYYDNRARDIRSVSVWKLFKSFFTVKKSSSIDESKKCQVIKFNQAEKNQKQFSSFKDVA